jgi:non-ribosomal peptide synthetase-like protein
LLDETTGQPTSANTGELCISGPGVAVGYVGRDSLTKEKFTIYGYRTGDRVTIDNERIFFHKRIDTQVKIRGFRIELDEIEQELLRINDDIQSAAVVVSNEQLIAFIVGQLTESHMREILAKRLPRYMVPNRLIKLNEAMPRLISGKIDRKALVAHLSKYDTDKNKAPTTISITEYDDHSPLVIVLDAFQQSFSHARPSENDDFFLDLGGHSMIAALTITKLRQSFPNIALQDLYECKTAARLAELVTIKYNHKNGQIIPISIVRGIKPTWTRSIICSIVQTFVLIILAGVASLEFLLPYILFERMLHHGNLVYAYLVAYGTFVVLPPFRCLLSIIIKWIVIGRYKEGNYLLWGSMYLRWWTVEQFRRLATVDVLSHTSLMTIYYRLLGAKIGQNVHLGYIDCSAIDLLEIGDGTTISSDVSMQTAFVDDYMLKFQRICIQNDVYIGGNTVLSGQTKIEDHSELCDTSFLPSNTCIPEGEVWRGSPATYWRRATSFPSENNMSMLFSILFGLIILLFIPFMYFLPMVPGLTLFEYLKISFISPWIQILIFSSVVGILYTCLVVIEIILTHYLLVRNMKVGVYSTNSFVYVRKWIFDRLSDIALHVIHTFYATLYITPFLRVLGMKIGPRCEFSTAIGMIPSLIEIGEESFIADGVTLGNPLIRRGQLHLTKTIIGRRVFIGNSALITDGIQIPNNCLIGCLSVVADGLKEGQSCFGSPAIILPRRAEASKDISEEITYRPPLNIVLKRFFIDTIRIFLPRIIVVFQIGIALEIFIACSKLSNFGLSLLTLPILYIIIFAIPSLLVCISLKWLIMGTYKTNQYAMWTCFVWTSEFVTATYEQLAVPLVLEFLQGTLLLAPVLRCFGMKIGHGCFLNTTDITEFDLVNIGNYATLNSKVCLQTHLFEDRVMKVAQVVIEDEATVGCASIMLPNTKLGQSAKLGPLSLMIKGEGILPNTSWQGIPIRADPTL